MISSRLVGFLTYYMIYELDPAKSNNYYVVACGAPEKPRPYFRPISVQCLHSLVFLTSVYLD